MHRSRLAGFIIDCKDQAPASAASFWSQALGMPSKEGDDDLYVGLDASSRDLAIEVQNVPHESRLHLDIESDDIDKEATRLEALGAKRIGFVKRWWVMEAPTGHRFCVIRARKDLTEAPGATAWPDP